MVKFKRPSSTPCSPPGGLSFSLSVAASDDAEAKRRFAALADRFGVSWMIVVAP